jgi:hypothetical protein
MTSAVTSAATLQADGSTTRPQLVIQGNLSGATQLAMVDGGVSMPGDALQEQALQSEVTDAPSEVAVAQQTMREAPIMRAPKHDRH